MTLFEVETKPPRRASRPLPEVAEKPTWTKYSPIGHRHRCDECVELAFETSPGPMLPISRAYFSRRQGGVTRYYCYGHQAAQRTEDRQLYGASASID